MCEHLCLHPYHPEFIEKYTFENIDLMIEIDLFWEVLQAQLRGLIINYASKKKKQEAREKELSKDIEQDTQIMHLNLTNIEWMREFKDKEKELEDLREYKLKGALIRARWQQLAEGEKPTRYFFNLENRNFVSKHIRELEIENQKISKPTEILNEMKEFYENLYREKNTLDINNSNYAHIANNLPKLNNIEKQHIDEKITLDDLKHIVYKSKNNPVQTASQMNFTKYFGNKLNYFYQN